MFGVFVFEDLICILFEGLFVVDFDLVFVVVCWFLWDKFKGECLR